MGSIDSSFNSSLNFSLPPPGEGGDIADYSKLVVSTKTNKPVGDDEDGAEKFNVNLNAIFGDDIDSLAEAQELTSQLNINLQLGGSVKNAKATMQQELDNLDPSNPRVPILGKYIDICNKLLDGKTIPGVTFGLQENTDGSVAFQIDGDNVGAAAAQSTHLSGKVGGNSWLAGNSYTNFVVNFLMLAKLMMKNKAVESKAEIAALTMLYEVGMLAADQIRAAGAKAAEMHKIAGICAAVAAAATITTTLISLRGMKVNSLKPEPINPKTLTKVNVGKVPELNNTMRPMTGIDGKPMKIQTPKYIEVSNGHAKTPTVYRNEGRPIYNISGKDSLGKAYLPRGQQPVQITSTNSASMRADLGIRGVNPDGLKIKNPATGKMENPDKVVNQTTQGYSQESIEMKGKEPHVVTDKETVKSDNLKRNESWGKYQLFGQSATQFSVQATKSVEEFLKIQLELDKSEAEALKEVFSTISRLVNHALDRATDGVKSQGDLLAQLIQQLDAIRAKLQEAITASMRKGSSS